MKVRKGTYVIILLSILITVGVLFKNFGIKNKILKIFYPVKYSEYVYKYSQENLVDPLLTFAIIKAESNFDTNIISSKGAIGLMQLMPSTAKETARKIEMKIEENILYNPEINIQIGIKYYRTLLDKYENSYLVALAAYNAGIGNVDRWIKDGIIRRDGSNIENIPYKETNNYIRKIVRDYKMYIKLYNN